MTAEPAAPGQTPIPVIIVEHGTNVSETVLAWSTLGLTLVTLLVLLMEIHKDHEIIRNLLTMIARLIPPYRGVSKVGNGSNAQDTQDVSSTV